jgi:hypothetical protein
VSSDALTPIFNFFDLAGEGELRFHLNKLNDEKTIKGLDRGLQK